MRTQGSGSPDAKALAAPKSTSALKMTLAATCQVVTTPSPGTLGWEGPTWEALL